VERTAAAGADVLVNVLLYILAWQMAGEPPRCWLAASIARWWVRMMCLGPRNIGLKVFQAESQLITIDPFRAAPELRALQPMNDEPKSLDLRSRLGELGLVARHLRSQITHQPVQRVDIRGKDGEIDVHAQILMPTHKSTHDDHPSTSTAPIARPSAPPLTFKGSAAFCRLTVTPASNG
jgi:hypothetical protein